jgi:hypothetical protein
MDEKLMSEAAALGINTSMHYMLPEILREDALRKDIAREKERMKMKRG